MRTPRDKGKPSVPEDPMRSENIPRCPEKDCDAFMMKDGMLSQ